MSKCEPCQKWIDGETVEQRERRFEYVESRALCAIMDRNRVDEGQGSQRSLAGLQYWADAAADRTDPHAGLRRDDAPTLDMRSAEPAASNTILSPQLPSVPSDDMLSKTTPLPGMKDDVADHLPPARLEVIDKDGDVTRKGSMSVDPDEGNNAGRVETLQDANTATVDEFGRLALSSRSIPAHERHVRAGLEKNCDKAGRRIVSAASDATATSVGESVADGDWELRLRSEDEHHLTTL